MQLDAILAHIAAHPDAEVDLAEVALYLAQDEYPDLDVQAYLQQLDQWADELVSEYDLDECDLIDDAASPLQSLIEYIFSDLLFIGNQADYYNPGNSFLNEVIETRTGIPITLSILVIAIGRRAGFVIGGLSFPGHFVVGVRNGKKTIVIDPFNEGQILEADECEAIFLQHGSEGFNPKRDLRFADARTILLRLLNNLKIIYARENQFEKVLRIVRRQRQLKPDDSNYLREEGFAAIEAQKPGAAIGPLTAYLQLNASASDAEQIRNALDQARKEVAKWN